MDDQNGQSWLEENKTVFIVLGIFLILAIVIILIFLAMRMANESPAQPRSNAPVATSTLPATVVPATSTLPVIGEAGADQKASGTPTPEQLAEKASFGDYYHPSSTPLAAKPADFVLPFNAKTEVNNYYDVDRKISLDAGLSSLDSNGFAVLNNPLTETANSFFPMYATLDAKQVPVLITGDFLIYYYQNVLKLAYQNVESSVFYDNLWTADQRLYQIAKQRYENELNQKPAANEVALEAARLETAYFATALSLLTPMDNQISASDGLSDSANFSRTDASQYSLQLPAYLQDDVSAEVNLIRAGSAKTKSPVLLYPRDYSIFAVPAAFKKSARLDNFYLASHWLNSVFPLYYRDAGCPNCLLDKDDWRINFSAAFLISSDLAADQNLQNSWAKIYKLESFFSGLRGDLNYLYYEQIFNEAFSGQADIAQVLQGAPADNDANLSLLQNKLAAINFSELEGGLNQTATATRPVLGFKMLTDSYWPDDYVFSQLDFPAVGKFLADDKTALQTETACRPSGEAEYYRCVGSAYDILNLIYPLGGSANDYFTRNSNYADYSRQARNLQKMLADFSIDSWHESAYWTTLDIDAKFLRAPEIAAEPVMKSAAWQDRNFSTAIAAWANEELPADSFAAYVPAGSSRLNDNSGDSLTPLYSYIEPDLTLSQELIADTQMIIQMLSLLNVGEGNNTVLPDLQTMEKNLTEAHSIIVKELQNQDLNDQDYSFIKDFSRAFSVSSQGNKSFSLTRAAGHSDLTENLAGVKLLVYSFARDGQKYFAVGPVFNWQEQ